MSSTQMKKLVKYFFIETALDPSGEEVMDLTQEQSFN